MNEKLTYRTATEDDVPALVELVQSAYRGDVSRQGWTNEADILEGQRVDAEMVTAAVNDLAAVVIVAHAGAEMVACCHLERRDGFAFFGMFAVRPTLQRGGVGRAVLAEAERVARTDWDVAEVRMTVIGLREELIAWYERRGYARTGESKPFPYGDLRIGVPLRNDLRLVVLSKKV
ncbi:N-acetyltransferase [Virgisporangium aliadipatigenens]|uniref:N-acetyltransferase n=1 Tax=Virgisporangium aliadipatigenens TaxID=741659 RepID=A0A8J4DNS9_9ACTN|nr:GNAT family N-acetyltransferase [Virgisporangium aliadipatigenens]GIJ43903.1 N-acetyltransferase [Virgisporangium aliadipatigenens]